MVANAIENSIYFALHKKHPKWRAVEPRSLAFVSLLSFSRNTILYPLESVVLHYSATEPLNCDLKQDGSEGDQDGRKVMNLASSAKEQSNEGGIDEKGRKTVAISPGFHFSPVSGTASGEGRRDHNR